jgi:hypothetical protein
LRVTRSSEISSPIDSTLTGPMPHGMLVLVVGGCRPHGSDRRALASSNHGQHPSGWTRSRCESGARSSILPCSPAGTPRPTTMNTDTDSDLPHVGTGRQRPEGTTRVEGCDQGNPRAALDSIDPPSCMRERRSAGNGGEGRRGCDRAYRATQARYPRDRQHDHSLRALSSCEHSEAAHLRTDRRARPATVS